MRYRLFLCDFDGTLVRADGTVSQKNIEAIAKYRRAGGIFAVVTGRGLSSILPRLGELGICDGLVVAMQGATVCDIRSGKLLRDVCFSHEDALAVVKMFERDNRHIHIYTTREFYSNRDDAYLAEYERICGVKAIVSEEPLSEKIEREGLRLGKILAMVDPAEREETMRSAKEELGENFFVTCSAPVLVEVMPKASNKGDAVRFLSGHYGLPLERIAAIGDQLNDLPMIETAGGKFTVENGEEELKRVACVVPSNEEDGVAYAIERYAMGEES